MMIQPSFAVLAAVLLGGACRAASALVLYEPALGTPPSAQGWTVTGAGGYTQASSGGVWRLDTSVVTPLAQAGAARTAPFALDTQAGFTLDFALRVEGESHSTPNRAGWSLIVTGSDPRQAIELAFWTDRVFAYTYDATSADRFVHGTEALVDTRSAARDWRLAVAGGQFSLSAGGTTLLGGALVDYTASGLPAYTTANALFLGDDTSRAQSVSELGRVVLTPVPEPATAVLTALGLAAVFGAAAAGRTRRGRQGHGPAHGAATAPP
jgi:hypothetical protein